MFNRGRAIEDQCQATPQNIKGNCHPGRSRGSGWHHSSRAGSRESTNGKQCHSTRQQSEHQARDPAGLDGGLERQQREQWQKGRCEPTAERSEERQRGCDSQKRRAACNGS